MLNTIEFSENHNGKLLLDLFTSIRLHTEKYQVGNVYEVMLRGDLLGKAKLVELTPFQFKNLNERTSLIDTGKSLPYLKTLLSSFYHQRLISDGKLCMLFFRWSERRHQAQTLMFKKYWDHCCEQMPQALQQQMTFTD